MHVKILLPWQPTENAFNKFLTIPHRAAVCSMEHCVENLNKNGENWLPWKPKEIASQTSLIMVWTLVCEVQNNLEDLYKYVQTMRLVSSEAKTEEVLLCYK